MPSFTPPFVPGRATMSVRRPDLEVAIPAVGFEIAARGVCVRPYAVRAWDRPGSCLLMSGKRAFIRFGHQRYMLQLWTMPLTSRVTSLAPQPVPPVETTRSTPSAASTQPSTVARMASTESGTIADWMLARPCEEREEAMKGPVVSRWEAPAAEAVSDTGGRTTHGSARYRGCIPGLESDRSGRLHGGTTWLLGRCESRAGNLDDLSLQRHQHANLTVDSGPSDKGGLRSSSLAFDFDSSRNRMPMRTVGRQPRTRAWRR